MADAWVLDASVVAALHIEDPLAAGSEELVNRLRREGATLHAPGLLLHEVASTFRRAVREGRARSEDCLERIARLARSEIEFHPATELAPASLSLALAHDLSPYDATYLALTLELSSSLATGDRSFAARAAATGVRIELVGPGEVPRES